MGLHTRSNTIHPFTQVAEIMGIVKHNDWVRPSVFQGGYNAVERSVEVEYDPFRFDELVYPDPKTVQAHSLPASFWDQVLCVRATGVRLVDFVFDLC